MQRESNTTRANVGARFALGETFITPGAQEALEIAGETAIQFLRRHMSGDWGPTKSLKTTLRRTSSR